MDQDIRKDVDAAVKQAKSDAEPADSELCTHVYSQNPEGFSIRTIDPFQAPVKM